LIGYSFTVCFVVQKVGLFAHQQINPGGAYIQTFLTVKYSQTLKGAFCKLISGLSLVLVAHYLCIEAGEQNNCCTHANCMCLFHPNDTNTLTARVIKSTLLPEKHRVPLLWFKKIQQFSTLNNESFCGSAAGNIIYFTLISFYHLTENSFGPKFH
jgi:hypothetical protein